jgi:hypothetical protein
VQNSVVIVSIVIISISTGHGYRVCFAEKNLQPSDRVYFIDTATACFLMSQGPIHTA